MLPALYNMAFRLTRDQHEAEDLVQDTYAQAFEHANELRNLGAIKTWIFRIMYHRFVALRRSSNARPELRVLEGGLEESVGDVEGPPVAGSAGISRLSRPAIANAIGQLPEDLRCAFTMRVIEGFAYREIAEIMDCPVGTVFSRISRARAQLMRTLAAEAASFGIGKERKR
jgi:RNA polymerase sigma-70 factor, ECF subfamily